jgi:hypothetical protein
MAGLLDLLQSDDPAVKQGILQFGLGLLSSKGNFGNALGNAGQQGLAGALQYRQNQAQQKRLGLQDQLTQGQIDNMKRQQELQALPGQFYTPGGQDLPGPQPEDAAGPLQTKPAYDLEGYLTALQGKDPMQAMQMRQALTPKAPELQSFAPGHTVGTNVGGKFTPQFTVPQEQKPENVDPFIRMLTQSGIDPKSPQGQKLINARLTKETTFAPPVQVNTYGSPVPYQLADGSTGYVQPGNKPGAAPMVMNDTTGKPFVKPQEAKAPPVEFTKSVAGLKELENGIKSYESTLKDEGGVAPLSIGEKRARLQSSYTALQMGMKNAFELGALAGPDLNLLQGMLIDPTSPRAAIIGDKGVAAQLAQARQYLKNRGKAVFEAHKQPVPAEYGQAPGMPEMSAIDAEIARRQKGK